MADRPLRPAIDHRLGRPLPHQLANRTQAPPKAPEGFHQSMIALITCGISPSFEELSPTFGQVTHALLTLSPLAARRRPVRLACVRHAASVYPEPGSNSPNKYPLWGIVWRIGLPACSFRYLVVKVRPNLGAMSNVSSGGTTCQEHVLVQVIRYTCSFRAKCWWRNCWGVR